MRGVTRPSECAKGRRVAAYTRFAPLLNASSTSARPMPRFAPVIKTVLFSMFIPSSLLLVVLSTSYYALPAGEDTSHEDFCLTDFGFPKAHFSADVLAVSFGPAAHACEWSNDRPSQLSQRILDSNGFRLRHNPGD